MALSKKIVTPAGNTLGDFGIITMILAGHSIDGLQANQCVVEIYNSEQDAIDKKPAVISFRYALGNVPYDVKDLQPIYDRLLQTKDSGNWAPETQQAQQNRSWVPGWADAEIVPTPERLGL